MNCKSINELILWATDSLSNEKISTSRLDAEVLLAYVLKKDRTWLYLESKSIIDKANVELFELLIKKRQTHIPVSHLTGNREFMALDFYVNSDVLIPRPETELLVEMICKHGQRVSDVLDLGTGSGAIAISIAKYNPRWRVFATDISMNALLIAKKNAINHDLANSVFFIQTDIFTGISTQAKFDWIVSNPPYIPTGEINNLSDDVRKYEPKIALDGGDDGLNVIRSIMNEAFIFIKKDGRMAIEFGYGQSDDVIKIADRTGKYSNYQIINDYANIPRIFCCKLK